MAIFSISYTVENRNLFFNCPEIETPAQFLRLKNINDKLLPTICRIKRNNQEPFYLGRDVDGINEWETYIIGENEECEFIINPNGAAAVPLIVSLVVSVIVGVATYLLTPRPNLGLNQLENSTSPTYDLTTQGNRVRLNQAMPIQYGTMRVYPDVFSNPWTESISNKRYYHILLNMGFNYIEVSDLKVDDTDVTVFPWVTYNVRYPGNAATGLFPSPYITSKEIRNVTVEDTDSGYYVLNDIHPTSKVLQIPFDFVNPRGLYYSGGINDRGTAVVATGVNINLASLPATIDGVAAPASFLVFDQDDARENGWWDYTGVGNPATRNVNMNAVSEFQNGSVDISSGTYAGLRFRNTVRILNVTNDPKIFVYYDGNKSVNETIVWIKITLQEIDNLGANVGSPVVFYHEMRAATIEPYYTAITRTQATAGRFEDQVVQGYYYTTGIGIDNFVAETSYKNLSDVSNMTEWIGFRGKLQISEPTQNDKTLIELKVQASGKLNDSNIGIWNATGKARLPVYNFGSMSWSTIQTNSPIWAWYDLLTNTNYGLRIPSTSVELANLEEIYNSINLLGLECNCRFDTAISGEEALAQIGQAMRCVTYKRGGKFLLARDEEKSIINGFFSRENIVNGSLAINFIPKDEFSPTWFKITYFDSITGKKETVDCVIPSSKSSAQQYS